ncbi:GerAB/ArcD/ProY family transporter [Priestia aryabhattai]|uniref:GerAB/ArcD/ProY family transporter n=1 Tax=Priestia TaxID=2800373 RepID=UPI0013F61732|nr:MULTISPECIES: GerAB/ArcD/ProY family transporter [Priestia]MEB4855761.1 GerAB/ArcD/ProY family transporter [Priestia megaterium]MED3885943.1 GerAB/ArcD/ProY family transporter [Priestia aryabhattai]MED4261013.1 GerAB/ArcD/ProY family transporter [Priestia aryabhattai]NHH96629.1 Spore germination protein YndE [Bacillus sp. MB95]
MNKNSISASQLFFIILQTQIGIGVLGLPYNLFKTAHTDGWISMLISGCIIQVITLFHWGLTHRLPGLTLYQMTSKLLGKWIGNFLNVGYVFYYIIVSSVITVLYVNVLKRWLYHLTPAYVLVFLLVVIALYFAKENVRNIGRFFTIVSVFLIILVLLVSNAYKEADVRYLFPIGHSGIQNILLASKEGSISMLGFEAILILAPFVKAKSTMTLKMVMLSNCIVTILYVYIIIACYMFFSPDEILIVPEPVLYILKATQNSVIERIDLVFITFWIISVITSLIMYVYISSVGMQEIFKKKTHRPFVPIVLIFVTGLSIYFSRTDNLVAALSQATNYLIYVFIFCIPICLLILSWIRKGTVKNEV